MPIQVIKQRLQLGARPAPGVLTAVPGTFVPLCSLHHTLGASALLQSAVHMSGEQPVLPAQLCCHQPGSDCSNGVAGEFKSALTAVTSIAMNEGPRGMFAGYSSFLLRDLPFDAIEFMAYEQLKVAYTRFLGGKRKITPQETAGLGEQSPAQRPCVSLRMAGGGGCTLKDSLHRRCQEQSEGRDSRSLPFCLLTGAAS